MREIKFRGYYPKIGCWIYGLSHFKYEVGSELLNMGAFWLRVKDGAVDSKTVGEWTGLKDRNGVEIFEGDVVLIYGYGNYTCIYPFMELYDSYGEDDIGLIQWNIHESPELIE